MYNWDPIIQNVHFGTNCSTVLVQVRFLMASKIGKNVFSISFHGVRSHHSDDHYNSVVRYKVQNSAQVTTN